MRRNVYLHIYSIGDLDDFFWPDTVWYGWEKGSEIQAVALLYTASPDPTLLAISEHIDNIGLNVKADNAAAIALYEKLGFEIVSSYYEFMVLSHP